MNNINCRNETVNTHIESPSIDEGSTTIRAVFMIFLGAYAIHGFAVVISCRHLYGDAAWYFVQMLSEGGVTRLYSDFSREFYYSRFLAFSLTQWPTVAALHWGITNVAALSFIYGATFFLWKFLSLATCYWLLPKRDKAFVVFPLLGVIAGTINSEIYLVTEIHISAAFYWPLLIAVIWCPTPLSRTRTLCLVIAIAIMSFLYESMALLLLAPLAALLWRLRRWDWGRDGVANKCILITILAAGIMMNWAAILFPRDSVNKSAFVNGVSLLLHDALQGIDYVHAGPAASIGFFFIAAAVIVTVGRTQKVVAWLGAFCLATLLPVHFLKYHDSLVFSNSINDRGFSGLVMQCGLAVMLSLAHRYRQLRALWVLPAVAILVGGLALGQMFWQALATKSWIEATSALRQVLVMRVGPLSCPSIDEKFSKLLTVGPARILCGWWVMPLSIVLAPEGQVKSIVVSSDSFRPFDPLNAKSLPSMSFVSVKYDDYLQSLAAVKNVARGETVAFTTNGQGWLLTTNGFSSPEPWGTWSDGKSAVLSFCMKDSAAGKQVLRLRFRAAAFVTAARPNLVVDISAGKRQLTKWAFRKGDAIVERVVDLPPEAYENGCTSLLFTMSDIVSPASLGISGDTRMLGVALVEMKVEP